MPEGDTIFRAAAALHRALAGRTVTRFETVLPLLARVHDDHPITGRTVTRAESMGKHLLVWFSGALALRTHMRMSGSWHLYRPGERWQRSARTMRVRIDTEAWVAVAFDVNVAEFLTAREVARSPVLRSLGPDLLAAEFDRPRALARLDKAGTRSIGEALLDQRIVAGIGNVFRSEVLFLAGVHPDTPAAALAPDTRGAILDTAVRLLRMNVGAAASGQIATVAGLRRTTQRASGEENLWVYDRAGLPCRTCGTPIASEKRGEDARATYWCPTCQSSIADR